MFSYPFENVTIALFLYNKQIFTDVEIATINPKLNSFVVIVFHLPKLGHPVGKLVFI